MQSRRAGKKTGHALGGSLRIGEIEDSDQFEPDFDTKEEREAYRN